MSFFLKDFSLYSNAPPSDSTQAWALGKIPFTAVMIWSILRVIYCMPYRIEFYHFTLHQSKKNLHQRNTIFHMMTFSYEKFRFKFHSFMIIVPALYVILEMQKVISQLRHFDSRNRVKLRQVICMSMLVIAVVHLKYGIH